MNDHLYTYITYIDPPRTFAETKRLVQERLERFKEYDRAHSNRNNNKRLFKRARTQTTPRRSKWCEVKQNV